VVEGLLCRDAFVGLLAGSSSLPATVLVSVNLLD